MSNSPQSPALSPKQLAGSTGTLAKGLLPLFRSGVLGPINPLALGKVGKGVTQWRFLPTGLLAIAAALDPFHTAIVDDGGSITY